MRIFFLGLFFLGSLSGCTTFFSWLSGLPPVTEKRCQEFDPFQFGLADGESAQRPGEKFEFWDRDCRQVGVRLNRPEYDRGYEIGLKNYCSCERGYEAGANEEYLELKGQYMICRRADFKYYEAGYKAATGEKIPKDQVTGRAIDYCSKMKMSKPSLAQ